MKGRNKLKRVLSERIFSILTLWTCFIWIQRIIGSLIQDVPTIWRPEDTGFIPSRKWMEIRFYLGIIIRWRLRELNLVSWILLEAQFLCWTMSGMFQTWEDTWYPPEHLTNMGSNTIVEMVYSCFTRMEGWGWEEIWYRDYISLKVRLRQAKFTK